MGNIYSISRFGVNVLGILFAFCGLFTLVETEIATRNTSGEQESGRVYLRGHSHFKVH